MDVVGKRGKTLVSSFLASAMMLGMVAMPGLEVKAEEYYSLDVGGVTVTDQNCNDLEHNHWSYDDDTHTLTLKAYECTLNDKTIIQNYDENPITIVLIGENKLQGNGHYGSGILDGRFTIKGEGSLEIKGTGSSTRGIAGSYTQDGGSVVIDAPVGIDCGSYTNGINVNDGELTINAANIGIRVIDEDRNDEYDADLKINGGTVTVNSYDTGIDMDRYAHYIQNGGTVNINAEKYGIDGEQAEIRSGLFSGTAGSVVISTNTFINDVPLWGWTNVEGTAGKELIPIVGTYSSMYSYKKIEMVTEEIKEISSLSFDVATPEIGSQISSGMSPKIDIGETLTSLGEDNYLINSHYYRYLPSEYGYNDSFSETVDYGSKYFYRIDINLNPISLHSFSDDVEITVNGTKVDFDNDESFVLYSKEKYSITFYGTLTTRDYRLMISSATITLPPLDGGRSFLDDPECYLGAPFTDLKLNDDYRFETRFVSNFPSGGTGWNVRPDGNVVSGQYHYYEITIDLIATDIKFADEVILTVNGEEITFDGINYEKGSKSDSGKLVFYCKVKARPEPIKYPLYIGSVQANNYNAIDLTTNHWAYDDNTKTLTLDGLVLNGTIKYTSDTSLNIVVKGENTITESINSDGNIILSGSGSFTGTDLYSSKDLIVNGGNWTFSGPDYTGRHRIIEVKNLEIAGGNINLKGQGEYYLIDISGFNGSMKMTGGTITADCTGGPIGIRSDEIILDGDECRLIINNALTAIKGSMYVYSGNVDIEASECGIDGSVFLGEDLKGSVKILSPNKTISGELTNEVPGYGYASGNENPEEKGPIPRSNDHRYDIDFNAYKLISFPSDRIDTISFEVEPPECGSLIEKDEGPSGEMEGPKIVTGKKAEYTISSTYISMIPPQGDGSSTDPEGVVWPGTKYRYTARIDSPYLFSENISLIVNGKQIDLDSDPDYKCLNYSNKSIVIFGYVTSDPNGPTPMPTLSVTPAPYSIKDDFPDKNFAIYVKGFDTNDNGMIEWKEVINITSIDVSGLGIKDLSGIEMFRNLIHLNCSYNSIPTLELEKNTLLQELYCQENMISILDLSKNKELKTIDCSCNSIADLELKKLAKLETLNCSENNVINLELKNSTELKTLICYDNMIISLDPTKNAKLSKLICKDNMITQLDISNNQDLIKAYRTNDKEKFDYDEEVTIIAPEAGPTVTPTTIPLPTGFVMPTINPTVVPTTVPSKAPTKAPTTAPAGPTNKPVVTPASKPTVKPTAKPTTKPAEPTKAAVTLTINKATVNLVCGASETLKATLKGSSAKIKWTTSDKSVATVDASGKVSAKMAGTVAIVASAAGKSSTCVVTVLYKDVTNKKDFWFVPTNYLTAGGIVKGYDKQTNFKPANDCSRAQMVTFLWRLAGQPDPKATTTSFKDIKKTDYFYKPVLWAVEKGITTGVSKTKFAPQNICTRAQTVTFLWRMAGKPSTGSSKNPFKDVKKGDYFYYPVIWASAKKIVAGYSDGTFKPQGKCLRRQMVTFLYKYDKFITGNG